MQRRRPLPLALLLAVMTLALVVTTAGGASAATTTVTLGSSASPDEIETTVGSTVTFRNADGERHRMRARDPEDVDSSDIDPGTSVSVVMPMAGTYRFVDERSDDPAYEVTVTVKSRGPAPAPAAGGSNATSPVEVSIPSRSFSPATVTVAAGGTVTWANRDDEHTVTARDASFDSGIFGAGGSFSRTFPSPGSYAYYCLLHPEMTGTVVVEGTGAGSSGDAPAARSPTPSPSPAPTTAPSVGDREDRTLEIVDLAFSPAEIEVATGTSLAWVNNGALPHTVTSTGRGPLGSEVLATGDRFRWTFDEPGTYDYVCALHPEMTGTVTVTAAGEVAPAAAPGSGPPNSDRSAAGVDADLTAASQDDDLPEIAGILLAVMAIAFVMGRVRRRA